MTKILVGLVIVAAGVAAMVAFRDPVTTYTVDIVGTGETVGERVDVRCREGRALGEFAGDERAEDKCALEKDSARTLQLAKFGIGAIVAIAGLGVVYSGYRVWWRDLRSGMAYRRMAKDHDLAGGRRRRSRKEDDEP
jgi:hypothetical protein